MTRVLSALILLPLVFSTIWFLPPIGTLVLAGIAGVLAFLEFASLANALGAQVPRVVGSASVLAACVSVGMPGLPADLVLMTALITVGALAVGSGQPGPSTLLDSAATILPVAYIGLPLGALAAIRTLGGREAMVLLILVIVASDSAQYYTGRAVGRRPLAPAISPKKTLEGAIGGVIAGMLVMAIGGRLVFTTQGLVLLALLGAAVAGLGIVGDLFESMLKRSAGIKDSSALIPGHGGMLDRIDSWLFAAPVYYAFVCCIQ
jgi:phosphatidate cytidylyltransferase